MKGLFSSVTLIFIIVANVSFTFAQSDSFDIQGHRGARGVLPENSIPAFIYAVKAGATTLEMDVVITKDNKVLISHEPWMSSKICLQPDGSEIKEGSDKQHNIYEMNYDEVKTYDCGSKGHPGFANQKPMKVNKPLLSEVVDAVEKHIEKNNLPPIHYNIEIKSRKKNEGKYHPDAAKYSRLVYDEMVRLGIRTQSNIQSFDKRVLREVKKIDPDLRLALLVFIGKSAKRHIRKLGFKPQVLSPRYQMVSNKMIQYCHDSGIKVIPWTVNDKDDMKRLIGMGVDGIITDYPKVLANLVP